jgi:hypothetical protein
MKRHATAKDRWFTIGASVAHPKTSLSDLERLMTGKPRIDAWIRSGLWEEYKRRYPARSTRADPCNGMEKPLLTRSRPATVPVASRSATRKCPSSVPLPSPSTSRKTRRART